MSVAPVQSTSFPWTVSSENKIRSKQSGNTKRAVKMMCSLQSRPMRLRTFSGLWGFKALDNMVNRSHGFHSRDAAATSAWRGAAFLIEPLTAAIKQRLELSAERVIRAAEEEARRLDQNFVGAELIFLGLINGGGDEYEYDIAASVLKSVGINLEDARAEVEVIVGRGSGPESVELSYTPRAKHIFELALEEARQLGHDYIASEHLLLGLLRVGEGVNLVLRNLGAYPNDIRSQVIRMVDIEDTLDGFKKTPTLDKYGIDLVTLPDRVLPVVGSQPLIFRVLHILAKLSKNNPCLVGEPGVGKTSIAQGLAQSIFYKTPPDFLWGKNVISLDMRRLVQVGFEERLNKLMDELNISDNIILFIDEIHTLFEVGAAEGVVAAANFLKDALARGCKCIGATTPDGYQKHMEKDPILERLFQPVKVPEPTVAETVMILRGIRDRYKFHHEFSYTDEALIAAAELSHQYISDRYLPGKAIDLINEAGSFVISRNKLRHLYDSQLQDELERVRVLRLMTKEEIGELCNKDLEMVGMLWDEEMDCKIRISEIKKRIAEMETSRGLLVTEADIKDVFSSWNFHI